MKRTAEPGRLAKLTALLTIAAFEAAAQEERTSRRIVISISDRKLILLEGQQVLKTYDVAVGAPASPSPRGDFKIVSRAINPVWKNVPPGPANPVGTRWLGLSIKGYGIHGTNAPASIGKAASHGCIRMRNRDVEELFSLVAKGTSVELDDRLPEAVAEVLTEPAQPSLTFAEQAPQPLKGE